MARRARPRRLPRAARAAVRGRAARAREPARLGARPADRHRRAGERPLQHDQPLAAHRHGVRRQLRRQLRQRPAAPRLGLPDRHRRAGRARLRDHRSRRGRRRSRPARPGGAAGRTRRRRAALRRRPLGARRPVHAGAARRVAPPVGVRRHRPGRRARCAVREHRQQPRPLHRPRRPRRRHGLQAAQGAGRRRTRRAQAAGGRPRAPRVHRLRGREAAQVQPDHLDGAAGVRHVGARQCARPGRGSADAQPP